MNTQMYTDRIPIWFDKEEKHILDELNRLVAESVPVSDVIDTAACHLAHLTGGRDICYDICNRLEYDGVYAGCSRIISGIDRWLHHYHNTAPMTAKEREELGEFLNSMDRWE